MDKFCISKHFKNTNLEKPYQDISCKGFKQISIIHSEDYFEAAWFQSQTFPDE